MRDYIDLGVLVNWVSMVRAGVDGAILIVDHEEEARFYERLIHESAQILFAYDLAAPLMEELSRIGIQGVVATIRGENPIDETLKRKVFRPTLGDAASLLLVARSSERVIVDVCGTAWIKAAEKEVGSVLVRIAALTRQYQQLREVCLDENDYNLEIQSYVRMIDWNKLELDFDRVREILSANTPSREALDHIQSSVSPNIHSSLLGCDGRDAAYMLAAATHFYAPRGIPSLRRIDVAELIGLLRVGFDLEEIETDEIFWQMKQWELENAKYPLLKEWRMLDSLQVVFDQRYWEKDLERSLRYLGSEGQMAAIKLDLDNFKIVNDTLGHAAGDEAIRFFCSIVKKIVGRNGHVYRRGGDEVVALIFGVDLSGAQAIAEDVRSQVELQFHKWASDRGLTKSPTASIGVVFFNGGESGAEISKRMDDSQRQAKHEGKNRVVLSANP
jgi:diguanylate cyclase (GGDEF)-like protein